MTEEPEPRFTDRRRIDPETGKLREVDPQPPVPEDDGAASAAGAPAGVAELQAENTRLCEEVEELKAENARLSDELARVNVAHHDTSQEYTKYVRRSKEDNVAARREGREEVTVLFLAALDAIELARQHGDLRGQLGSMLENVEATFQTNLGLERFGVVGEEFDPHIHEALMSTPSQEVEVQTVSVVIQPGYRMGEKVLRAARVAVSDPVGAADCAEPGSSAE